MRLVGTPLEAPVPMGAVGPTTTELLEMLLLEKEELETLLLVLLKDTTAEEEMTEELEVAGILTVLFVKVCEEVALAVDTPVVKITEEETLDEVETASLEVLEALLEVDGEKLLEVLMTLLDVVEGATLLLLELVGASLILRAPRTPLLVVGLPSFFFI